MFIVEKWNPYVKIRQDMGGFADLVAIKAGEGVSAVQVTTGSNLSARREKLRHNANAQEWVCSGGKLWLHGWRKIGPRGKAKHWDCIEEPMLFLPTNATQ